MDLLAKVSRALKNAPHNAKWDEVAERVIETVREHDAEIARTLAYGDANANNWPVPSK